MGGVSQSLLGLGVDAVRSGEKALRPKGPGAEVEFWGKGSQPFLHQLGGLGSAVISSSGIWGRAPAEIEFGAC